MITLFSYDRQTEVWTTLWDGKRAPGRCLGSHEELVEALIEAEHELRTDLDEVQARLTAERARLKAEPDSAA